MNKKFIEQLLGGGEARVGDLAVLPEDCRPGELGQGDRLGRGRREWKKSCGRGASVEAWGEPDGCSVKGP